MDPRSAPVISGRWTGRPTRSWSGARPGTATSIPRWRSPACWTPCSAPGAAIGSIPGARAVHVPRSRFAPVKTTDDLLLVRSDAYELTSDGQLRPGFDDQEPVITLDENYYKLLPDFEQRFPAGAPSVRRCRRFDVEGDVTFGADVVAVGKVRLTGPCHVPDGEVLGE
jgi:UTP--glucose-1-phosphate uridylyltransferase